MVKKYKLTEEKRNFAGRVLHRIEACIDFDGIKIGDKGGWVESERNLSQYSNAWVFDDAKVYGDAKVFGNAKVYGNAEVFGDADYIVFKNWWSSGRYFTWTRSNNRWAVGCFHGTGEELVRKAYADSDRSGREYERVVKYVESILADESNIKQTKDNEQQK